VDQIKAEEAKAAQKAAGPEATAEKDDEKKELAALKGKVESAEAAAAKAQAAAADATKAVNGTAADATKAVSGTAAPAAATPEPPTEVAAKPAKKDDDVKAAEKVKEVEGVLAAAKAKAKKKLALEAEKASNLVAAGKEEDQSEKEEVSKEEDEIKATAEAERQEEDKKEASRETAAQEVQAADAQVAKANEELSKVPSSVASQHDAAPDDAQDKVDKAVAHKKFVSDWQAKGHKWPVPQVKLPEESVAEQEVRHTAGLKRVQAQLAKTDALLKQSSIADTKMHKRVDKVLIKAKRMAEKKKEEAAFAKSHKMVLDTIDTEMNEAHKNRADALVVPDPAELLAKSDAEEQGKEEDTKESKPEEEGAKQSATEAPEEEASPEEGAGDQVRMLAE
jgi:hypothetical protein